VSTFGWLATITDCERDNSVEVQIVGAREPGGKHRFTVAIWQPSETLIAGGDFVP